MKDVEIYTDGSCKINPGPGGWCSILVYKGKEKVLSGGNDLTTNNRMELTAVIEAIKALKEPCNILLTSDSKYVLEPLIKEWVYAWKNENWRQGKKSAVKNPELWDELLSLLKPHSVKYVWVKGHNGHPYNERCDKIAQEEAGKRGIQ